MTADRSKSSKKEAKIERNIYKAEYLSAFCGEKPHNQWRQNKMSKLEQVKEVVVRNNETGAEFKYLSKSTPNKSNLGNSFRGTINVKGIQKLQNAGHKVYDNDSYKELIANTYGLDETDFGVGPDWSTPADREKFSVFIDGEAFTPEISKKVLAKLEAETQAPAVVEEVTERVVAPVQAVADTTKTEPTYNVEDIKRIQAYLVDGFKEADIKSKLIDVYGEQVATLMMNKATQKDEPVAPSISFAPPVAKQPITPIF